MTHIPYGKQVPTFPGYAPSVLVTQPLAVIEPQVLAEPDELHAETDDRHLVEQRRAIRRDHRDDDAGAQQDEQGAREIDAEELKDNPR